MFDCFAPLGWDWAAPRDYPIQIKRDAKLWVNKTAARQKGGIRLINADPTAVLVSPILAARRYVSPRARPITPEEAAARHTLGFGTGLVFADASPIDQPPAK